MKQSSLHFLFALVVFLIALLFTTPASAHGDEPRIEISTDRLNPGSVIDLRGVAFEMDEAVTLTLVGPQQEVSFGTVLADTEGVFLLTITLPADLSEGNYVIRATTDDHSVESPQITVVGSADLGEGNEDQRQDEDPLLAPMPTFAANPPTPISQSDAPVEAIPQKNIWMPVAWIAGGIGFVVMLGLVFRRRKS
jgi:hypothetical protein